MTVMTRYEMNNKGKKLSTPLSPCIGNCCLNKQDMCVGCFRTLSEITAWSQASDARKAMIIIEARQRAEKMKISGNRRVE